MVGAPNYTASKARLERDRTRAVVATQRDAFHADALRIDVVALLEPIDDATRPVLAVVARGHAVQAQRLAGAGLVDHERGDTTLGEPGRQTDAVLHLLGRIEAVDLHEQRCTAAHAFGTHVERRQLLAFVRDLDALAVLVRELGTAREELEKALVQHEAPRRAVRLQALAGKQVNRGTVVLLAGRHHPATSLVLAGKCAELLGHKRPGFAERRGAGSVGLLGRFCERRAHLLDLADPCAHLDGKVDAKVPDVVGGEVSEHMQ